MWYCTCRDVPESMFLLSWLFDGKSQTCANWHSLSMHFGQHKFLYLSLALISSLILSHHLLTVWWHLEKMCKCIFFTWVWTEFGVPTQWENKNRKIPIIRFTDSSHLGIMALLILSFFHWNHLQWERARLGSIVRLQQNRIQLS